MTKTWKRLLIMSLAAATVAAVAGCGGGEPAKKEAAAPGKTKVKTVVSSVEAPLAWADEKGEMHGYEVDALREINKHLKTYELDLQAVPPETQDVMMESGDAKVATGGYVRNPQREKNFNIPTNPLGTSNIYVYVVKGDEKKYKSLADVGKAGLTIVPLTPNGGTFRAAVEWNEKHGNPVKEIPIQTGISVVERVAFMKSGQCQAYISPDNLNVVGLAKEQGMDLVPLEEPIKLTHTYVLVNKKMDKLSQEIDDALKIIFDDGTLGKLNVKWFGADNLSKK